jgi:hypothetical protein
MASPDVDALNPNGPPRPIFPNFTRMQELRLELHDGSLLPELAKCRRLRVLQLCFREVHGVSATSLCAVVASNAKTLEEVRFSDLERGRCTLASALGDGAADAAKWRVLAKCVRLRVLELPLMDMLPPHLL